MTHNQPVPVDHSANGSIPSNLSNPKKLEVSVEKKNNGNVIPLKATTSLEPVSIYHAGRVRQLAAKYQKTNTSNKAKIAYWWAVMSEFRPTQYSNQFQASKLSQHQYKSLISLYESWGIYAFLVLGLVFAEWEHVKYLPTKHEGAFSSDVPKLGPSTAYLSKYADTFYQYGRERIEELYASTCQTSSAFLEGECS